MKRICLEMNATEDQTCEFHLAIKKQIYLRMKTGNYIQKKDTMKNIFKTIALTLLGGTITFSATAQQDTSINRQVEVVKAYQPSISDAYKISSTPRIVDTIEYTPTFEYQIISKPLPSEKVIQNLPYVKLGNPPKTSTNKGYLKGGIGNAYTPYAELLFNTSVSKNTDFGFQVFHYSSQPKIKLNTEEKIQAPYSKNFGRIFIKNHFKKAVLDWDVQYNRTRDDYYGFALDDKDLYQKAIDASGTQNKRQAIGTAAANARLTSLTGPNSPSYVANINYEYLWNMTGQTAHTTGIDGVYRRKTGSNWLNIQANLNFYKQQEIENIYDKTNSHNYFQIGLTPTYELSGKTWNFKAGLNTSLIAGNDTTAIFHISPKLNFEFHPIKDIMTLFIGTDGSLKANNYSHLVQENPFVHYTIDARPTNEIINITGGIKGKISSQIAYLFDASYQMNYDQYFYILNQSIYPNGTKIQHNTFNLIYDDINTLRFGGNIRYSGPALSIGIKGNVYQYDTKSLTNAYQLPRFDATADIDYEFNISDKPLVLSLSSELTGPRKALIQLNHYNTNTDTNIGTLITTTPQIVDLKTIIDINLSAQYHYTERLAFFLRCNNLLNANDEVWHGYNNQGINFLIGARYSF